MTDRQAYNWVPQECPICEVRPTKLLGHRGGEAHREHLGTECEIWRCGRCGLIFPNPMPLPIDGIEQHYHMMPGEYFKHHDEENREQDALGILQRAEQLAGAKGRLLDIGAGRGELLRAARKLGWSAIGIEPSESFADYAVKHSGAEVRRQPVEQCGFAASYFDVVIMGSVLEHLYNPGQTIKEIARILRPGGALLVDVPNERGLYFLVGNLYEKLRGRNWVVNTAPTFPPFHVFGFGSRSLRTLLAKHGLRPVDWNVYAGRTMLPSHGGAIGVLEQVGAKAVTAVSKIGNLGTYIITWAIKVADDKDSETVV